ncbi:MAG: hypothetical protein AVDCRST_MAG56-2557 [uncultured Cytophagales bacterium]|uniref:Uncharacterized protein n=1 Tax=uncultured Cytophagales bacterium TaxID=158755 RepID=A0A6J4IQZ8_9SPHI|nr:MAG: hypothetical protein AVDCRST_MAG56-2557 [uncultured Cytophagales bacterium]
MEKRGTGERLRQQAQARAVMHLVSRFPSLRAGIVTRWYRYALVSFFPYVLVSLRVSIVVWAPVVSRRVGPAQWRGAG